MTDRQAKKYLEECASTCPYCEASAIVAPIRRAFDKVAVTRPLNAPPELAVRCYCRCGADWIEQYRLESVL